MSKPRVIQADFATWRPVSGRKVLQLIFEVPIEQTQDVMEKLGVPTPGESKWCAIALLKPEAEGQTSEASGSSKSPKPFSTLPLSQQAAIRCQDNEFKLFIGASNAEDAAAKVREQCGVTSRSELDSDGHCANLWRLLERKYQAYLTDGRYAGVRR